MSGSGEIDALMSQMAALQSQFARARSAAAAAEIEGSAGQGAVRVRAQGEFEFTKVTIDPALFNEADPALLEDLVLAAIRDAIERLAAAQHAALGDAAQEAIAGLLGGAAGVDEERDA